MIIAVIIDSLHMYHTYAKLHNLNELGLSTLNAPEIKMSQYGLPQFGCR
jgi:hypothetical protein